MASIINVANIPNNPAKANWKATVKKYLPEVSNLPQVKSGLVSTKNATQWLGKAAMTLSESELRKSIHYAAGFNEQDVRALWAHDNNEYYAKYHASEVYALKRLEAIAIPSKEDKKAVVLESLFKSFLCDKYDFEHVKVSSAPPTSDRKYNWVNASPTVMKTKTGENLVISLKFNYKTNITQSDDIRNHVQILSLLNANQNIDLTYQYNVNLPAEKMDVLASTALLSEEAYISAVNILKEWDKHADDMQVDFEKVTFSKSLFTSISETSSQHWKSLLAGQTIAPTPQPDSSMTRQQEAAFQPVAKRYAAAQRLNQAATEEFEAIRNELINVVEAFGPARKLDSQFDLVKVGAREQFDIERAVNTLARMGVDPSHYSQVTYDAENLAIAAKEKGINPEEFKIYGTPDKQKVIDTLTMQGIDTQSFYTSNNHIHFTGQSRGDTHDRIVALEEQTQEAIKSSINAIAQHIPLPEDDVNLGQDNKQEQSTMEINL
jgi:septum formation topological specificity factor MinE